MGGNCCATQTGWNTGGETSEISDLLHALGLTPTYVTESHTPHSQLADVASSTHMAHRQGPVAIDMAIFLSSWPAGAEDVLHRGIISWPYRRHVTSWPYHNRIVVYPSLMCMCMWPSVCVLWAYGYKS